MGQAAKKRDGKAPHRCTGQHRGGTRMQGGVCVCVCVYACAKDPRDRRAERDMVASSARVAPRAILLDTYGLYRRRGRHREQRPAAQHPLRPRSADAPPGPRRSHGRDGLDRQATRLGWSRLAVVRRPARGLLDAHRGHGPGRTLRRDRPPGSRGGRTAPRRAEEPASTRVVHALSSRSPLYLPIHLPHAPPRTPLST